MEIGDALKIIIGEDNTDYVCRPFCLYSRLSDFVGADYCERDKLKLLFKLDKRLSLVKRLFKNDITEVARIGKEFSAVRDLCDRGEFDEILNIVSSVLVNSHALQKNYEPYVFDYGFGNEPKNEAEDYLCDKRQWTQFTVSRLRVCFKIHIFAGHSSFNKTELVRFNINGVSKPQTAPPQSVNHVYYGKYRRVDFRDILPWLGGALAIAILIAGITCLAVFASKIQWFQWQYIIGSGGGLLTCGIGFFIALGMGFIFDKISMICSDVCYILARLITVALIAVANFALAFIFGELYYIIFYWLSGYLFVSSVIELIHGFYELNARAGIFGIIDGAIIAGMLVTQVLIQVL